MANRTRLVTESEEDIRIKREARCHNDPVQDAKGRAKKLEGVELELPVHVSCVSMFPFDIDYDLDSRKTYSERTCLLPNRT